MTDATPDQPSDTIATLHHALVDQLCQAEVIRSAAVEAAFRAVPRHLFLPGVPLEQVYRDRHIVTKRIDDRDVSSSSQPAIMAIMLEHLGLQPGQQVLEIGAGTGYNAALMAHLVGTTGQVTTIEIDADIVDRARAQLAVAGCANAQVVCGDGALGYASAAPYDRIIVTARAPDVLPAWMDQLKPGGRLVTPLLLRGAEQKVITFERAADHLVSVTLDHAGFIPLRGAFEVPEQHDSISLEPAPGYSLQVLDRGVIDAAAVAGMLNGPWTETATPIRVTPPEMYALHLWLTMHESRVCGLIADGALAEQATTPHLFVSDTQSFTEGLVSEVALSVLVRAPSDGAQRHPYRADEPAFELWIRAYGQHAGLTQHLHELLVAWDGAGRPGLERLRIRIYPQAATAIPAGAGRTIPKPWSHWIVDWPERDV